MNKFLGFLSAACFCLTLLSGCGSNASFAKSASAQPTCAASGTCKVYLNWDAPPVGSPTLAGYKVHYGTQSGNYPTIIDVGNVTSYVTPTLPSGTYYFVVTDYTSDGLESTNSNEAVASWGGQQVQVRKFEVTIP